MSDTQTAVQGPDLTAGIALSQLIEGRLLLGHVGDDAVIVARRGSELFAIGATCTHYSGPLAEGLMVGDTVRCPWHHACFSLRTGEALRAPALNPVACYTVEQRDGKAFITEARTRAPLAPTPTPAPRSAPLPRRIGIVGAGAAGAAAAEMLRREGYDGAVTVFDPDPDAPYDRPNLSKDYLAGNAPEEWIPLRPADFYAANGIEVVRTRVAALDAGRRRLALDGGGERDFDRVLIATGADPVRLPLPGAEQPHVFYLRSLADSRAIVRRATEAKRAVVVGASFIGLEVAASLRARGLEVHVVAPEARPFERVLGPEAGDFMRGLHEEHGVTFHLRCTATEIRRDAVALSDGTVVGADLVVLGVGVRPSLALAERAGLALDRGVAVNEYLETSAPGVFAAGDIARWPDARSGSGLRVEHWVVAERQGQTAARNLLGAREAFTMVPFFWTAHYDVQVSYVGHADRWDRIALDGSLRERDCTLTYYSGGRPVAVASIFRDHASLAAEEAMERSDWAGVARAVAG